MKIGVPLQQKIHFGEHEKHEKEKANTLHISEWWIFFRKALYIRLFGYRLRL